MDLDDPGGLYDTLKEMMKDMFLQATMFPRIDSIVPIATYEGYVNPIDTAIFSFGAVTLTMELF